MNIEYASRVKSHNIEILNVAKMYIYMCAISLTS